MNPEETTPLKGTWRTMCSVWKNLDAAVVDGEMFFSSFDFVVRDVVCERRNFFGPPRKVREKMFFSVGFNF